MAPLIAGTVFETIFSYHAATVDLGAMAERAGVPHVVLTHLIPPPDAQGDTAKFADDLRTGGYGGRITVGEDLTTIRL
jgi:ribonuclease Z